MWYNSFRQKPDGKRWCPICKGRTKSTIDTKKDTIFPDEWCIVCGYLRNSWMNKIERKEDDKNEDKRYKKSYVRKTSYRRI